MSESAPNSAAKRAEILSRLRSEVYRESGTRESVAEKVVQEEDVPKPNDLDDSRVLNNLEEKLMAIRQRARQQVRSRASTTLKALSDSGDEAPQKLPSAVPATVAKEGSPSTSSSSSAVADGSASAHGEMSVFSEESDAPSDEPSEFAEEQLVTSPIHDIPSSAQPLNDSALASLSEAVKESLAELDARPEPTLLNLERPRLSPTQLDAIRYPVGNRSFDVPSIESGDEQNSSLGDEQNSSLESPERKRSSTADDDDTHSLASQSEVSSVANEDERMLRDLENRRLERMAQRSQSSLARKKLPVSTEKINAETVDVGSKVASSQQPQQQTIQQLPHETAPEEPDAQGKGSPSQMPHSSAAVSTEASDIETHLATADEQRSPSKSESSPERRRRRRRRSRRHTFSAEYEMELLHEAERILTWTPASRPPTRGEKLQQYRRQRQLFEIVSHLTKAQKRCQHWSTVIDEVSAFQREVLFPAYNETVLPASTGLSHTLKRSHAITRQLAHDVQRVDSALQAKAAELGKDRILWLHREMEYLKATLLARREQEAARMTPRHPHSRRTPQPVSRQQQIRLGKQFRPLQKPAFGSTAPRIPNVTSPNSAFFSPGIDGPCHSYAAADASTSPEKLYLQDRVALSPGTPAPLTERLKREAQRLKNKYLAHRRAGQKPSRAVKASPSPLKGSPSPTKRSSPVRRPFT